jgi:uncharacterized protein YdeI (YjbR/CyaY-like superfamily)
MHRYTSKNADGAVIVAESDLQEALNQLAKFEDAYEELVNSQKSILIELEKMKLAGKEKTVRYKEIFAQKLYNLQIAAFFERHGLK